MVKYDDDFKMRVVQAYLNDEGGYKKLANLFGIPHKGTVRDWVKSYLGLGEIGIQRKKNNSDYPLNLKMDVIQFYLNSGESIRTTANNFGLNNPSLITRWLDSFQKDGIHGLSKKRRRPPMSDNIEKNKKKLTREELERENELLRAQLAFIKKLKASGMNIPERLKK